ncbi:hypothetical protein M434DRAFT_15446 [Hypoxylon sp. CO27-5]|nr:hypothetical protein M434DRAFT_15446 [Hypoxylon sp. CO27-5]
MSNNLEVTFTSPPGVEFFLRRFEEKKAAFIEELGRYAQDPKKYELEQGVAKRNNDEDFELEDHFLTAIGKIGVDTPTISIYPSKDDGFFEYSRLYQAIIFAGHVLEPYFGYYRIAIHPHGKTEDFSILPRHHVLPTAEEGSFVHWKWGDREQLDRYQADPLAEWKKQCGDDKIPYRDSPGLDWNRGLIPEGSQALEVVVTPLRYVQNLRKQLHTANETDQSPQTVEEV